MTSLNRRLLTSVLLLLLVFFGLTIFALDFLFRDLSERSLRESLDAQLVALIAASEPNSRGDVVPAGALAEARLRQPGSGLYAEIRTRQGDTLWRSQSSLGTEIDFGSGVAPGARRYERRRLPDRSRLMVLASGVSWEIRPGMSRDFVFSVATDLKVYDAQLQRYRGQLLGWFLGLAILLLIALAALLRWVLAPVRRIEAEIREIEAGSRSSLGMQLPRELTGLAANLNALLTSERRRVERYRNTLGNLAHSLKTPLAVMRSGTTLADPAARQRQLDEQIDRMDQIVQHQLKRAAATGASVVGQSAVEVQPILAELRSTLLKVYGNKDLMIEVDCPPSALFAGDRGDLFELLGNLLDNASKWCRSRVRVRVDRLAGSAQAARLRIAVEDDGAGVAEHDRQRILERGTRADEAVPGQGLGLAMVKEIVTLYEGTLSIEGSSLGGARIEIVLPAR
jgi:two-component system, OmpR family, sensor histidine kinase PhoQ